VGRVGLDVRIVGWVNKFGPVYISEPARATAGLLVSDDELMFK